MRVVLGEKMEGWNGHAVGETVGLEDGMRETLAREYIRQGAARFVAVEQIGEDPPEEDGGEPVPIMETEPTKRELSAFNRAIKADDATTKDGVTPKRRVVRPRCVDPRDQEKPPGKGKKG